MTEAEFKRKLATLIAEAGAYLDERTQKTLDLVQTVEDERARLWQPHVRLDGPARVDMGTSGSIKTPGEYEPFGANFFASGNVDGERCTALLAMLRIITRVVARGQKIVEHYNAGVRKQKQ